MKKSITFKGSKLTRAVVKNNIIRVYDKADSYSDWYKDANAFCKYLSDSYKIPLNSVVGIVSALSPLKTWDKNKEIAEYYLDKDIVKKDNKFINFPKQCDKAMKIRHTDSEVDILDILRGEKTKSFYLNISYPERMVNVTVDRHAIAVALGRVATDEEQALSKNHYKFFEDCYKWTAEALGIRPLLLQSITWETWRNLK
jgi:hypothetical protein